MRSGRVTRAIVVFAVLSAVVVALVSIQTSSDTKPTSQSAAGLPRALRPSPPSIGADMGTHSKEGTRPEPAKPSTTEPPSASAPDADDSQVATGSGNNVAAGDGGPATNSLTLNPFNFRLGLINGTVVKPDARNWAARTVSDGPLLVFLPATGHVPNDYRKFLTVAAESGYHVLGLDFWNQGKSVAKTCGVDARCYTMVQRNRFNGSAPNQFSKVDATNSVVARLKGALTYLQHNDADGGWGQYLRGDDIQWQNIVVSGHSQGGGESAYIAHRTVVKGQLTFASPIITDVDTSASWLKKPSRTPASRMYGFDSVNDVYYPRIAQSWTELGLGGAVLKARVPVPTSSKTHRLATTMNIGDPGRSHLRTITDGTPTDSDGTPVFEPTWKWMLNQIYVDKDSPAATADKAASSPVG